MGYSAQTEVATIVLWNFFAFLINVAAFAVIYMKANRSVALQAFFRVEGAMIVWLVGKVLKTVAPNEPLRWFFIVFYYFGICWLEAGFLDFAFAYYKGRTMKKGWRIAVYTVAAVSFAVVATNPYHHLFYSTYDFWRDTFGPLFYVHVGINYLLFAIGAVWCSIQFKKQLKSRSRLARWLIAIAIVTPLVFNFIYITRTLEAVFDYLGIQIFDITPIVYTWSILLFVYATFKYAFFDLSPIMKHEVVERLDVPILVVDGEKRRLYANAAYGKAFGDDALATETLALGGGVLESGDHCYKYAVDSYKRRQYTVSFSDISAYAAAQKALARENASLRAANAQLEQHIELLRQSSLVGARNYIARELHDVLGHALVVTVKLLEVAKVDAPLRPQRALASLEKAAEALAGGFDEMKAIAAEDSRRQYSTAALEKEIAHMLKVVDVSGLDARFFLRGQATLDAAVYDALRRVVTELVTNTLKHAEADKLLISMVATEENIRLQVMDNGKGAETLLKGNGLSGIDSRLAAIGGTAKYSGDSGEGFAATVTIGRRL
ncbi:sensor histidine kinase [Fusibacter sp. JL298sf-3]